MKNTKEKPRNHKCEVCGKCFLGKNDLRKHSHIHSGAKPFQCSECERSFRQAGSLKNHCAAHHSSSIDGGAIFVCLHCKKAFPIKERLRLHLRTHTGYKPYECPECPKKFARCGQLKQHSRTHSGARPYKCEFCEWSFTSSGNLKLHMNGHLNIRDYTCDQCGKRFLRPDALKKHISCFHENVKAFRCNICNKDYKGHLPQHMRTHFQDKRHGCSACGATFAQRSQLTVHQRKHSGERPYRCKVCWRAFAHSTALKLHIRLHTGEKPFKCKLCVDRETAFSQLPHLKKHMLCVHKTDKSYICDYCKEFFKTKVDLEYHVSECKKGKVIHKNVEEAIEEQIREARRPVDPPMPLEKMRLLLAVLLKKISNPEKLAEMGFNKILIDYVLNTSIKGSGREPCTDTSLSIPERLKRNVQILLEWTVPKEYMDRFRNEQRSTEEVLEELTS